MPLGSRCTQTGGRRARTRVSTRRTQPGPRATERREGLARSAPLCTYMHIPRDRAYYTCPVTAAIAGITVIHTNTVTELRGTQSYEYDPPGRSHARKLRSALIAQAVAAGAVAIGIIAPLPRAVAAPPVGMDGGGQATAHGMRERHAYHRANARGSPGGVGE